MTSKTINEKWSHKGADGEAVLRRGLALRNQLSYTVITAQSAYTYPGVLNDKKKSAI